MRRRNCVRPSSWHKISHPLTLIFSILLFDSSKSSESFATASRQFSICCSRCQPFPITDKAARISQTHLDSALLVTLQHTRTDVARHRQLFLSSGFLALKLLKDKYLRRSAFVDARFDFWRGSLVCSFYTLHAFLRVQVSRLAQCHDFAKAGVSVGISMDAANQTHALHTLFASPSEHGLARSMKSSSQPSQIQLGGRAAQCPRAESESAEAWSRVAVQIKGSATKSEQRKTFPASYLVIHGSLRLLVRPCSHFLLQLLALSLARWFPQGSLQQGSSCSCIAARSATDECDSFAGAPRLAMFFS